MVESVLNSILFIFKKIFIFMNNVCLSIKHLLVLKINSFCSSHFKQYINIIGEFIPQMLFMICIFGWLCFMILTKWIVFYEDKNTVSGGHAHSHTHTHMHTIITVQLLYLLYGDLVQT